MVRGKAVRTFTLAAGLALGLAQTASVAQCTWFIPDVPDIDQARLSDLPNDGLMYCAPTSMVNWFAYVANRGVPQPLTLDGPRNWEDGSNYNHVTDVLTFMGALMETDPVGGTKGGMSSGAQLYATFAARGDFIISGNYVWSTGTAPSPSSLTALNALGAYTCISYGRYGSSTGGTRGGGHVMSVTGVWDLTCGQAPILQFSDPADDRPPNQTQSDFRTSLAAMTAVTGQFRPTTSDSFSSKTLYRLDVDTASNDFLDAVYAVVPTSALFSDSSRALGQLNLVTPFRPTGNPAPASRMYNTPTGSGEVLDVAAGPMPLSHYYLTARTGQQNSGAWKLDLVTGVSTRLTTNLNPSRLVLGRLGDLYVLDGNGVNRYDLSTTPPTLLTTYSPSADVVALAYDDKNDTVMMVTQPSGIGPRRVLTFPRTLTGFGTDRALPVTLSGELYIAPDAESEGAFFICGDGSGILYRIAYSSLAGGLVQTDSIVHINGSLSALNVTDANRLVYAVGGVLVEREKNSQGQWVSYANSRWSGRAASGKMSMVRSRTNFVASVIENASFNNLANPTIFPSLPTCDANCDNSSLPPILNANDFLCFINAFAARKPYANCDHSSLPPILNANDFQCFINKYAAGCT